MSFQTVVLQAIAQINTRLNAIASNAKRIFEFPEQATLNTSSKIHVDNAQTSEYITVEQIVDEAKEGVRRQKETFTATAAQVAFVLSDSPLSVDVEVDRVVQIEITDFTHTTNTVTLIDAPGEDSIVVVKKYY